MTFSFFPAALMLASQSAVITDLSELPVQEAAAPRCGVVFAVIEGAQKAGDERAKREWPDMVSINGKEFFVQVMAKLMDDRGLTREALNRVVRNETSKMMADDFKAAHELREPCLMMKQSAGL